MAYFSESMTSVEAGDIFAEFNKKVLRDEIPMEEYQQIVREYNEVSSKIFDREMKAFDAEYRSITYLTEDDTDVCRDGDHEEDAGGDGEARA